MPRPFVSFTLDEFGELLARFPFSRRIDAIHMHHTWRPTRADFRGEPSIESMWRFHTQEKGWSDIAQHVTIAPDGRLWSGRDWNRPPASAAGYNGNATSGPFMFEVIGDFDSGCDRLEGAQRAAVVGLIARLQLAFNLPPDSLRFHRSMTDQKTCPGTGVDYDAILAEVKADRDRLAGSTQRGQAADWSGARDARSLGDIDHLLKAWRTRSTAGDALKMGESGDAEAPDSDMTDAQIRMVTGQSPAVRHRTGAEQRAVRALELTPEVLNQLRPHVVNLAQGHLSSEGRYRTSKQDVDTIFGEHLPRAAAAAKEKGVPLRLLFWAHGGLINEAAGLEIAHLQISWWKRNNVYPLHFVWETGFLDALRQLLAGTRAPAPRGVERDIWDHTTDLAVETAAGALGGDKIWLAMKQSAELASAPDGGAAYVAEKLTKFCQGQPGPLEVHAVGHSAGSIFHAHFLPAVAALGGPEIKSLHLLAPAIRADVFKERLAGLVGRAIKSLTMFTMARDWEEDDNVVGIYRKSLLYLIHHALEPERRTPILGLEVSVRGDSDLSRLFGLGGAPAAPAEIVWAVSQATDGRSASTSRTHGGFDNDRPTMNSVARRILGTQDIVEFPEEAIERGLAATLRPPALLFPLQLTSQAATIAANGDGQLTAGAGVLVAPFSSVGSPSWTGGAGTRRRALCVGIDAYSSSPLSGCVADAREWADTLESLGFTSTLLLDAAATRETLLNHLRELIGSSRPGDVVVFQFAGHGTELPDLDGDEVGGTNGPTDEALCPFDFESGAFLIDDDIAQVFAEIPTGVNVTCFIDCCHSGTITRFAVGQTQQGTGGGQRRARFLPATGDRREAHRAFRERHGLPRTLVRRAPEDMRQVLFAACLDREVAMEDSGHGEFTVRASRVLRAGIAGVTHEEFQRRVTAEFGAMPQQHPDLDCAPRMRQSLILQPLSLQLDGGGDSRRGVLREGTAPRAGAERAAIADAFKTLSEILNPRV